MFGLGVGVNFSRGDKNGYYKHKILYTAKILI